MTYQCPIIKFIVRKNVLLLPLLSLLPYVPPLSHSYAAELAASAALRRSRVAAELAASSVATEAALRRSRVEAEIAADEAVRRSRVSAEIAAQ